MMRMITKLFSSSSLSSYYNVQSDNLFKVNLRRLCSTVRFDQLKDAFRNFPLERIRNFCIIAHVDHGKSTLADRILELTGSIEYDLAKNKQVLDTLQVERERGITVKAQTASMLYKRQSDGCSEAGGTAYLLNLVDTPGHVDFNLEVKRSLRACQGALLLVDSTQGVQAQTLANFNAAKECGLVVIPCLTKLDLPHSDPAMALQQLQTTLGFSEDSVIWTSAKTGEGVDQVLEEVIKRVPPPEEQLVERDSFLGYIADSWFDQYRGVICLIAMQAGKVNQGDTLFTSSSLSKKSGSSFEVQELGILTPTPLKQTSLTAGQVGYLVSGIKTANDASVGDLISNTKTAVINANVRKLNLPQSKPMLFASVYPYESSEFDDLKKALDRLALNDSSVSIKMETSTALGQGFRCGFLGKLHMEVFFQRLNDEQSMQAIITAPSVPYFYVTNSGEQVTIERASDMPSKNTSNIAYFMEKYASVVIVTPPDYLGALMEMLQQKRAIKDQVEHVDSSVTILRYRVPWEEVVVDMHDLVKKLTSGYATLDYEDAEPLKADIVCVDVLINGKAVDTLSFISNRSIAEHKGRTVALKLKEVIKRQQFEVVIQAAIGTKIIARERIPPVRKNVLQKSGKVVGGGDSSRKKKLLQKQKEGKKRLKMVGNVQISPKAFLSVFEKT